MASYFSSDYHLGHANIIKYDKRPFKSVSHMDKVIIDNHNSVVGDQDDFYFLGDFTFTKDKGRMNEYFESLQGNMYFIRGNHDHRDTRNCYAKYGTYLGDLAEVHVNGQLITLCHYSMEVWNKSHHGAWHLFGHSHHSLPVNNNRLSIDVGVNGDGYNYKPLSFAQVKALMAKKTWKPVDHHTGER